MGACQLDQIDIGSGKGDETYKACPSLVTPACQSGGVTTVKFSFIKGRMAFSAKQSLDANNGEATAITMVSGTPVADDSSV